MKALVVKLSAFGDIIHALPALDDLLANPQIDAVHWLVDARYAFVTELFPQSVKVHIVALKGEHALRHAWKMIRELRREQFDLVFDLQGLIKSGIMAHAAGGACYGFDARESPEWPNRLLVRPVPFAAGERHVVQKYRRIVAAPFMQPDGTAIDYAPPAIHKHIEPDPTLLRELGIDHAPFTLVHVGGGWQTKQLPLETWQELACAIAEQGQQCVLSWGTAQEAQLARTIAGHTQACVLPERLSIARLCQLLVQASAAIGHDTGLLHLAAALGVPTVTVWGPSASWNAGAKGAQHRHVESDPACGPCFKRRCDNFICLPSLTAESIIDNWNEVKR